MKVILVNPKEYAICTDIGESLEEMQAVVGGYIESLYPFDDVAAIICNEEGKLRGMPLNRALLDDGGDDIVDIIAGTFFICGIAEDSFCSLTDKQAEVYLKMFKYPEVFYSINDKIVSVKVE